MSHDEAQMTIETPSCHMMIELSRHVSLKKRTDGGPASLSGGADRSDKMAHEERGHHVVIFSLRVKNVPVMVQLLFIEEGL